MRRVLFLEGAGERGGAQRVLLALARHLREVGVDPTVAFLAEGPFLDEVERAGVAVVHLPPAPRVRAVWEASRVAGSVASVARGLGASVIQANGEKMAVYAARAARHAGCASVAWLHDAPMRSPRAAVVQALVALGRYDALVAGSEWMARSFRHRLGLRVRVIQHGIDLDALPERPVDIRGSGGWPNDAVVVGHFGRLQRWKGAEDFLEAAAYVAGNHPAARFLVVGGALHGWEREYAEALPVLAAELGLGNRVRFLGHRDDALAVMAGCDVVVHCSRRREPFGLVVVEAMAVGSAVIATRTGGPEEAVDEGRTGLLVRPGDPVALAGALDLLMGDPAERARLARAGAEAARRTRSARAMAEGFAALYQELAPACVGGRQ